MAGDLNNLLNELVMQTGGASASPAFQQPQAQNAQKLELKQQMSGLANTQTGIDILKQIVNNSTVDIVERTAAAEVLNPGTAVEWDAEGRAIFNSPASNVNYTEQLPYTTPAGIEEVRKVDMQSNTAKKIATVPELLDGINQRFNQLQTEQDPVRIAEGMATLNQSVADFQAARVEELRNQSRTMFGIDQFESQIETDRRLDMQESQEVFGVDYMGPSEVSQATIQQLQMATGKANEWLQTQLQTDPTLAAVNTKQAYLKTFADSKFKELGEVQSTSGLENLVSSNAVDATLIAIGTDPLSATPEQRRQVSLSIQSGNQYYSRAMQLGLSPAQLPVFISNGGEEANMARNVLINKAGGDTQFADEMITAYNNFETWAELSPEELEERGLVPSTTIDEASLLRGNSKEARAQEAMAIKQARWNFIQQAYNERATGQMLLMEGFQGPQADSLVEWNSTVEALQSAKQATKDETPVQLTDILQRLTWPTDKVEAQRKEDDLVDYLYYEAQQKGNGVIGLPNQFGNKNLIRSYVQTNRVNSLVNQKRAAVNDRIGRLGGAATLFGGLGGLVVGGTAVILAEQEKNRMKNEGN